MARAKSVIRLVHVTGLDGITAMLQGLPAEMRANIVADGVKRGAVPMEVAAKRFAKRSERTGWLRKSITTIVRKYPANGVAVAIIGPVVEGWRRGAQYDSDGNYFTKTKASKGYTSPSVRYAHLIEFGHHIAKGGSLRPKYTRVLTSVVNPDGKTVRRWRRGVPSTEARGTVSGWVPAKPFMKPAFATTQSQVLSELYKGIEAGIEKTRTRLIKSGAHAA